MCEVNLLEIVQETMLSEGRLVWLRVELDTVGAVLTLQVENTMDPRHYHPSLPSHYQDLNG